MGMGLSGREEDEGGGGGGGARGGGGAGFHHDAWYLNHSANTQACTLQFKEVEPQSSLNALHA